MLELNKKLAEWAGFRYRNGLWIHSERDGVTMDLLNFTDSLDACFKWLVPKLLSWGMDNEHEDNPNMGIVFYCTTDKTFKVWEQAYVATPALALCKAIEKLIDG